MIGRIFPKVEVEPRTIIDKDVINVINCPKRAIALTKLRYNIHDDEKIRSTKRLTKKHLNILTMEQRKSPQVLVQNRVSL